MKVDLILILLIALVITSLIEIIFDKNKEIKNLTKYHIETRYYEIVDNKMHLVAEMNDYGAMPYFEGKYFKTYFVGLRAKQLSKGENEYTEVMVLPDLKGLRDE